jgi:L-2-hydroxyglutarate oxidase LhgO
VVNLADGQQRTIEDLEAELAMREWLQKQQMKQRHPEMRQNNFFMQHVGSGMLQREMSLTLQKQDSIIGKRGNALNLEEELHRI